MSSDELAGDNTIDKMFRTAYTGYDLSGRNEQDSGDSADVRYRESYNANTLWSYAYAGLINTGTAGTISSIGSNFVSQAASAITSISTKACFGSSLTANAQRAGYTSLNSDA